MDQVTASKVAAAAVFVGLSIHHRCHILGSRCNYTCIHKRETKDETFGFSTGIKGEGKNLA